MRSVQTKPGPLPSLRVLYLLSFTEGGLVMISELAGARLLTPYFGASLYSWASTLSITLLALMAGYYCGGQISVRPNLNKFKSLVLIFAAGGLALFLMPGLGHAVMKACLSLSFFSGLLLSELCFLFPPIFFLGLFSPILIAHITSKAEYSGRSAGVVYAISTFGGILFTLVFGFLLIPKYGIQFPLQLTGLVVMLGALMIYFRYFVFKKAQARSLLVLLPLMLFLIHHNDTKPFKVKEMRQLEFSEGLLGELQVVEQLAYPPNMPPVWLRKLKVNNVQQNLVFANMPTQSVLYYVNFCKQLVNLFPRRERALLVGLGAGSLYKVLSEHYKNVESVELDERIYKAGIKYFDMKAHTCHFTDGRYFLNSTRKRYDLIMLDVIVGESVPSQLLSLECFKTCYNLLEPDGVLMIEHGGLLDFSENAFLPSLLQTLRAAQFRVSCFNPMMSEKQGDALILASKKPVQWEEMEIKPDVMVQAGKLKNYLLSENLFDRSKSQILTDDRNNADLLLRQHYFHVRKGIMQELAQRER
ncbi:MAG TPA: fused MFS/spermidine synthase [Bacteroidia bacterium]|nr:fused MFS/spermidine synthase [Bacteroidia bacterium]